MHSVLLDDGSMLHSGETVHIYTLDPDSDVSARRLTMRVVPRREGAAGPEARAHHMASAWANGFVIAGGNVEGDPDERLPLDRWRMVWYFNADTEAWSELEPLPRDAFNLGGAAIIAWREQLYCFTCDPTTIYRLRVDKTENEAAGSAASSAAASTAAAVSSSRWVRLQSVDVHCLAAQSIVLLPDHACHSGLDPTQSHSEDASLFCYGQAARASPTFVELYEFSFRDCAWRHRSCEQQPQPSKYLRVAQYDSTLLCVGPTDWMYFSTQMLQVHLAPLPGLGSGIHSMLPPRRE